VTAALPVELVFVGVTECTEDGAAEPVLSLGLDEPPRKPLRTTMKTANAATTTTIPMRGGTRDALG
jgi:hypothetical protein